MTWSAVQTRWSRFRNVSTALVLSAVLTFGLILIAGVILLRAHGSLLREADKDALNVARAAGEDIARNLELYDLQLRTIARQMQNPGVQELQPDLRWAIMFDGVARDEHLGFINVLNADGDVVADSASAAPRSGNFASRDYFQAQRHSVQDALFIGEPFDKVHGAWSMIAISHRVSRPDGSFAGVVMGSVRLDYFAKLFNRFAIGRHGTITLLLANGMVLQRSPAAPGEIGHIPTPNLLATGAGAAAFNAADPVDGRIRRFVLYRADGLPLFVAVGLAQADIEAAWSGKARMIASALIMLGVLNAALLLWLWHAERKRNADAIQLRGQALTLEEYARQHARIVAEQKQAHERRLLALDDITHDVRTLLHSLLGHADLVQRKGPLNPKQMRHLASLRSTVEHLRHVADRFLRDARQGDGPALLLEPTDIRALIDNLGRITGLAAEEKGLSLNLEVDGSLPPSIVTDGRRLSVILDNLLDNAIKCTGHGVVALHVSLESGALRCVISDTGPGMPEAQRQRLLAGGDDFAASPGQARRGLSIIRRHIEALGGEASCLHNPGGGTIITFSVPVTPALTPEPVEATSATRPMRILLVDDSAASREPTAELLRDAGHHITTAHSGEAAVQLLRETGFDAVILDARMHGLSGPETARRIRAVPGSHGRVPIIVLSATPREQGLAAWQQAAISGYVEKSSDLSDLLRTIALATRPGTGCEPPLGPGSPPPACGAPNKDHLSGLAQDVLRMRILLDGPGYAADRQALLELVHRLAGDTAQLGFTRLSTECRHYERAASPGSGTPPPAERLLRAANEALAQLHQRLQELNSGEVRSARPLT
ncbi:MAG TPA: response regulator [Acetobacteraceae bacterium]|nr:response regulator [Acetobacteraceae bacterium]